jgi:hypothetical protein
MRKTRLGLALACLAIVGAAIGVAGGSAGNRTGEVSIEAFPGSAVTAGKNVAYKSSFENTGSSTFTHVELRQKAPVASPGGPATLVSSSCGAVVTDGVAVCGFDKLASHATVAATLLWKTPSGASCASCLTADVQWVIKEGKPTNSNESFGSNVVTTSLLGSDDPVQAAAYETGGATNCTSSTGNLHTNQTLGSGNRVSTTICLPTFTIPSGSVDLGLASLIVESATHQHDGGHPELGQSDVCIATFGQSCGSITYTPQNFSPQVATFIFRIDNSALTTFSTLGLQHHNPPPPPPSSKKITQVWHNGTLLSKCTGDPAGYPQGCYDSITQDPLTKVWTVVARARSNGYWDW